MGDAYTGERNKTVEQTTAANHGDGNLTWRRLNANIYFYSPTSMHDALVELYPIY